MKVKEFIEVLKEQPQEANLDFAIGTWSPSDGDTILYGEHILECKHVKNANGETLTIGLF